MVSAGVMKLILKAQRNELSEYQVYTKLASRTSNVKNKELLLHLAKDEMLHHDFWKKYSKQDVEASGLKVFWYTLLIRCFGLIFGIKLMEGREDLSHHEYIQIYDAVPGARKIEENEDGHESRLIRLLSDKSTQYTGSIVLGLNDALVELTGALAGLTLAFQKTTLVAIAGLITGIAAAFSMSASEYLSVKAEGSKKPPLTAAVYTGIAYIVTVFFLVFPYFVLSNPFFALLWTISNALIVILLFTFYISAVQEVSFAHKFFEMTGLSLGVALITFGIGYVIRIFFNIDLL
ncbi:MAG: VIT1/CCC1 transporter family protein [Nanoarchaeota archaeon]|nr:VIT1/CCC1 transporter family protein [Nanoarchaeota archaeon]